MSRPQPLILPSRELATAAYTTPQAATAKPSLRAVAGRAVSFGVTPPALRPGRRARPVQFALPLALAVLAFLAVCALVPGWVAPYAPGDMQGDAILGAPSLAHWFGTDAFGRDVFSLVVFGARQSLLLGLSAVIVGGSVGVLFGILAGYAGGRLDAVLMRLIDVWMAVPNLLLAIALATALGPGVVNTILAISMAMAPRYARVLRGQAISVRSRPFIEAARAAGASHFAILRGHILPHCAAQIMVMGTLGVGTSILTGAALSFLGMGINDVHPDWGYLLTQGRGYMTVAWWTVTFPGIAITVLVISINLLGDSLRRKLDPRQAAR